MKRLLLIMFILMSVLIAGCAPKSADVPDVPEEIETPAPAVSKEPENTPKLSKDKVLDSDGKVILDGNGHFDGDAFMANLPDFTTEELIRIYPYSDGAYSYGITDVLSQRLLDDTNAVIELLAAAETSEDKGEIDSLAFGIGTQLNQRVESSEITVEACDVLYDGHDLSARGAEILGVIVEGFEAR